MYQADNEEKTIYFIDDRNTASPAEMAKYPLTEEERRRLDEALEKVWREFGLADSPPESPVKSFDVAKYILEKQGTMSTLKLEKLCYYAQAWHYTWTGERLIAEEFQAWKHGPVCYDLFKQHKKSYNVTADEISGKPDNLSANAKDSIDIVLEHYGDLTADELVKLTHSEEPWLKARGDLPPEAHSDAIIPLKSMGEYYRKHLI